LLELRLHWTFGEFDLAVFDFIENCGLKPRMVNKPGGGIGKGR
jgi:hypothetical protein